MLSKYFKLFQTCSNTHIWLYSKAALFFSRIFCNIADNKVERNFKIYIK